MAPFAPNDSSYLLLGAEILLPDARIWTPGNGLGAVDNGGGGTYVVTVDESELNHAALDNLAADSHTQYILKSLLSANGQLLGRAAGVPAAVAAPATGQLLGYAAGLWAPVTPGQRITSFMLKGTPSQAAGTIVVANTNFVGIGPMNFTVPLDDCPFTDFRVIVSGNSNTGGQTITALLATFGAPGTAIHTGDTGLVISSTPQVWDSGWLSRNDGATGLKEYQLSLKGSNGSVNLAYSYLQLHFRWNLPLP